MQHVGSMIQRTTYEERAHCPEHGEYTAEYIWVAERWVGGRCPQCVEAERQRQEREEQERQLRQRIDRALRLSGIPARFEGASFDTYEPVTEEARKIRDRCRRYAETFPDRLKAGTSLILSGGVGTGKTHLACAIARYVITEHLKRATYTSVVDAVRQVRRTYDRDTEETESDVLDRLSGVPLLILDEVGVQSGTDHEYATLFEVLNRRYADVLPTILISNLGMEELKSALSERVVDRMLEEGVALPFTWSSYRRR